MPITVTLTADNADALRGELRAFLEDTQADASGMARVTVAEFQGLVAQLREADRELAHYRAEVARLAEMLDAAKRDGGAWHLVGEAQQRANEFTDLAKIYGARLEAEGYDLARVRATSRVARPHSEAIPLGAREASGCKGVAS